MNYQLIELSDTQFIQQPYDDEGNYYCSICGQFHHQCPSYFEDGTMNAEVCHSCGFMAGKNDVQSKHWSLTHTEYLNAFRVDWLDSVGWSEESLKQMTTVLRVDVDELKDSADKLRAEWKRVKEIKQRRD